MKKYFKEGQTVYSATFGKGVVDRIDEIDCFNDYPVRVEFKDNYRYFTLDGRYRSDEQIALSQNPIMPIVNKPLDDNYIRFTFEDREFLRGKWIRPKNNNFLEKLIITFYPDGVGFYHNLHGITYQELLDNHEFIDGSPCGKLVL